MASSAASAPDDLDVGSLQIADMPDIAQHKKPRDEPTTTVSFPITEDGSHHFGLSEADVKLAKLMVGRVCLGYAFPTVDRDNLSEMVDLSFFGKDIVFHSMLVQPHSKIFLEVEYFGKAFPKLHLRSETVTNKTWESVGKVNEVTEDVTITNANGEKLTATLVYTRVNAGFRNVKKIEESPAADAAI